MDALRLGTRLALGPAILLVTTTQASADKLLYFSDGSGTTRGFYDFDTTTHATDFRTSVAGTDAPGFFALDARPPDGVIFAVDFAPNSVNDDT
jgi:hypothetical protein